MVAIPTAETRLIVFVLEANAAPMRFQYHRYVSTFLGLDQPVEPQSACACGRTIVGLSVPSLHLTPLRWLGDSDPRSHNIVHANNTKLLVYEVKEQKGGCLFTKNYAATTFVAAP